jgi:hypothetical protein
VVVVSSRRPPARVNLKRKGQLTPSRFAATQSVCAGTLPELVFDDGSVSPDGVSKLSHFFTVKELRRGNEDSRRWRSSRQRGNPPAGGRGSAASGGAPTAGGGTTLAGATGGGGGGSTGATAGTTTFGGIHSSITKFLLSLPMDPICRAIKE